MKQLLFISILMLSVQLNAQLYVTYTVNANTSHQPISPYIFGSCNGGYANTPFMRQGGNRITGYNWENNASNAGQDYLHQSDDYLTWISGINFPQSEIPGIVTTSFIDSCNARNAFSAVTLQMAGYVAKDKTGPVSVGETAPSARWCSVSNTKPSAFTLTPDLSDNVVYMDEYMNLLINTFGNSTTATGVKAYILDNETTLWPSTHPRIHPNAPTCAELLQRSVPLATRIKNMDANALVFGPESYGFYEYTTYQGATDWGNYSGTYPYFLSFYLDSMRIASVAAGHRLLDVFSVHWYPDVYAGNIFSDDTSTAIVATRIQLPRSLWDNTYIEDGWIGEFFSSSLPILPTLKSQINTYYPNTRLGITEYDYGADNHISGGLAQADALGAFARTGVSYASKWGAYAGFSLSAVRIYDDIQEPFSGYYIPCSSNNLQQSTVHCSVEDTIDKTLHIVILNKNLDSTITAIFNINSTIGYDSASVYWFDKTSTTIHSQVLPDTVLNANVLSYILQPGSVYHFVLKNHTVTSIENVQQNDGFRLYPNPADQWINIDLDVSFTDETYTWNILDMNGKMVLQGNSSALSTPVYIGTLAKGNYVIRIQSDKHVFTKKFVK
jgi:mannan endo-1,4-beta-mannosidase